MSSVHGFTSAYRSYRRRYKYVLTEAVFIRTPFIGRIAKAPFVFLNRDGWLTVQVGYAWDGASGPTWDSPATMRGSLVHDVIYQLLRMGLLVDPRPDELMIEVFHERHDEIRRRADAHLVAMCREDVDALWRPVWVDDIDTMRLWVVAGFLVRVAVYQVVKGAWRVRGWCWYHALQRWGAKNARREEGV